MKPLFSKITIVGVGLIGGSLGLAIKKRKLAKRVIGVTRRRAAATEALRRKTVDSATLELAKGVVGADLVILAGPGSTIIRQIAILPKHLSRNTIVIDAGSSKMLIEKAARRYLKHNVFVGCHPMAGSEKKGVRYADDKIFEGHTCYVVRKNAKVMQFWRLLGTKPIFITPKFHDIWIAQASHLPHVLAFALFKQFQSKPGFPKNVTNPSIRDFVRISKGDPDLWSDILVSNRQEVSKVLSRVLQALSGWKTALKQGNLTLMRKLISDANKRSYELAPVDVD